MGFQIAALLILAAFYGCYFTKMLLQRRKGIQTDQMGRGAHKHGIVKGIEVLLKIITILTPLAELVCIGKNLSLLPTVWRATGIVLGVLGTAAFACAAATMRDSWRAGVSETDKTELVTDGIFRWSRNPAFLGFDLMYLGILLMFFSPALLAVSAAAMLMLHLQIVNVEEDFLTVTFGTEYAEYRKRVNRYFGHRLH